MAQNVYDDPKFFEGYIQLPRQVIGLDGAPEWEALRSMLPGLRGKQLLDLGCGFGWVCRWAREQGAEVAHGVDVSENMLAKARSYPKEPSITYQQADLETFQIPSLRFDVVFSSLTLHYLKNLSGLIAQVYQGLSPGGTFVFSVEHPIWTAPRNPHFVTDSEGQTVWPLDGYLTEGSRTRNWIAEGVIKQHRTIARYITMLLDAGFILSAIEEWGPSPEQIAGFPKWAEDRKRPPFLLMKATKPKEA